MAYELIRDKLNFPFKAQATIAALRPVKLGTAAETVALAASSNDRPFGFVSAGVNALEQIAVREEGNYVKAVAAASLGANQPVMVGSVDGSLIHTPITASAHWEVGVSMTAAPAGGVFTVFIKPRKA